MNIKKLFESNRCGICKELVPNPRWWQLPLLTQPPMSCEMQQVLGCERLRLAAINAAKKQKEIEQ
jgi:hypothetical protein